MNLRHRLRQLVCRHRNYTVWACEHTEGFRNDSAVLNICSKCHATEGTINKGLGDAE